MFQSHCAIYSIQAFLVLGNVVQTNKEMAGQYHALRTYTSVSLYLERFSQWVGTGHLLMSIKHQSKPDICSLNFCSPDFCSPDFCTQVFCSQNLIFQRIFFLGTIVHWGTKVWAQKSSGEQNSGDPKSFLIGKGRKVREQNSGK